MCDFYLDKGWTSRILPRALRYMCLRRCDLAWRADPKNYEIDLQALPQNMEELIVERGWYAGRVVIDHLPETMRLLLLYNEQITRVYFGHLPPSLEHFLVFHDNMQTPAVLTPLVAGEVAGRDERVGFYQNFVFRNFCADSHWYGRFSE